MTLLKERGRSDDNDARAFLLSNTTEERAEFLWIVANRLEFHRRIAPLLWVIPLRSACAPKEYVAIRKRKRVTEKKVTSMNF
jgi:hypothetical protein